MAGEIPTGPLKRPGTAPIPAAAVPTGPPAPRAAATPAAPPRPGDRSRVAAGDPLAKPPAKVDMDGLGRTAAQLGQALDAVATGYDAGSNAADAVAYAPDALKETLGRLGRAKPGDVEKLSGAVERAQKAGRVLGAAGAIVAARDLYNACIPQLDPMAACEALSNFVLGIATAGEGVFRAPGANAVLGTVGGVAGLVSSLFALVRDVKDAFQNGINLSNGLGMLGNALTAVGSAMLLIPGLNVVGGALLMAGASLNLTRLAVDNWDAIKEKSSELVTKVGGWLSKLVGGPAPPARTAHAPG